MEKITIIGLGGGGYMASIYASRYGLNPLLIGESDGGLIVENHIVENFPGYPQGASGYKIMEDLKTQAQRFDVRILQDSVRQVLPLDPNNLKLGYKIFTTFNGEIESKTVVLAIGTKKVKLGVEGEEKYFGKGVSYCATCDGFFYKGKTVAVVGGGDTALIEAIYLAGICEKVYIIHRRSTFRGEKIRYDRALNLPNIEIIRSAVVDEIDGEHKVNKLELKVSSNKEIFDQNDYKKIDLQVDGIFVAIGTKPNQIMGLQNLLNIDNNGYIIVDEHMQTNLPGIYGAGDCTTGSSKFRQLITACSEGAICAESAFKYLSSL